jgi:uncharacterized protein YdhG (YjbR/CyaY superfamily)
VTAKPTDVDGYLAAQPEEMRAALERLRRIIRAVAPDAVESISYGMPTFKYRGKRLAYFAAWKSHCALYGLPFEGHEAELASYDTDRGTIRFPPSEPFPEPLLRSMLTAQMAAIEAVASKDTKSSS